MSRARKTDGNPLAASQRHPANDNGLAGSDPMFTPAPRLDRDYLYVDPAATPANQNDTAAPYLYVTPDQTSAHVSTSGDVSPAPVAITVFCDLPSPLPVLPQEVALIRAYLPALLARIAANDNEP